LSVQGAKLRIDVFDVAGRRVRSLVDQTASQGQAQIEWNLLDNSGRRVASGLYMVRVGIGDTRKTFPLLVLR
jgi:flagellar hook assembly protein FlgD